MTQVLGIPYRRHGPSAALRQFLDHLDPGDYFDCGRARLHGLDDALLEEARQRGLDPGDDAFVLVATDTGLIFCRPSINYAITAGWDEITVTRPRGDDPVVLPIRWPRHGELKFTVSKRLAGNVFRRWLQLRVQADRVARDTRQHHLRVATGQHPRIGSAAADPDAEVTGEPAVGDLSSIVATGESAGPTVPEPERSSVTLGAELEGLQDDQLRRVPKPGATTAPPSWVGSAVSVAATLVVLTTVVLLMALGVGLYRSVSGGGVDGEVAVDTVDRTTIDHARFRTTDGDPAPVAAPADGTTTSSSTALPASTPGGASEDDSTSSQQLLAVPPGGSTADPLSPLSPSARSGALRCNSNYGGCVPDVSDLELDEAAGIDELDVDCPGEGDGPWFAEGEVAVLGDDVYGLDADGDGRACEPDEG